LIEFNENFGDKIVEIVKQNTRCEMNRNDFMNFFRDDDKLNTLSPDDRVEIFETILLDGSDITVDLLRRILSDYSVENIAVSETYN
jgi:hypothetical protein